MTSKRHERLLIGDEEEDTTELSKRSLLNELSSLQQPNFHAFTPDERLCLKTKDSSGNKVFVNICVSTKLPSTKLVDDDELSHILDSDDPSSFRVPLSLGEPHQAIDKSSKECSAYDCVVHPDFYERTLVSQLYRGFLFTVILEGLEGKYDMKLSRDFIILKNKKYMGEKQVHFVKKKAKPWIAEVGQVVRPSVEPKYEFRYFPNVERPCEVSLIVYLPNVPNSKAISVDLGDDRVVIQVAPNRYYLDVDLPCVVNDTTAKCSFYGQVQCLVVGMSL